MASTILFFEPVEVYNFFYKLINGNLPEPIVSSKKTLGIIEKLIIGFLIIFFLVQIAIPLRHNIEGGNVAWDGHGHRYSWRMKLVNSNCDITMIAFHNQTKEWFEVPSDWVITTRQYQKSVALRPEFLIQYANKLAELFSKENVPAEIYTLVI